MSSYFDNVRKEVGELSRSEQDPKQFLLGLIQIEGKMIRDCELFAGDIETPEDVRQAIMGCIAVNEARFEGDMDNLSHATQMDIACRSSRLEAEMHSLWHDIARMDYKMRYGRVSDNPEWAVQRRDTFVKEHTGPHPWQKKAPTAGEQPLRFLDYRPKERK